MKKLSLLLFASCFLSQVFGQTFEQRKQQYIDSVVTNSYEDAIVMQAFRGDPINQQRLDEIYTEFGVRSTIDFRLVELVRVMFLTDGSYDNQILEQMETLPYWINYGDTLHNYWTENHMIMWMGTQWLMHERHGWEIDNELKKRLLHYLNLKLDVGFYEFFSSTYWPFTVSGLMNLADFAEDQEIRSKAEAVVRKLFRQLLMVCNSEGAFYPAAGRNYPARYLQPYNSNHAAIIYLISGRGPCPSSAADRADFVATSSIDFSDIESEFMEQLDTIFSFGHTPEEALLRHDSLAYVDELIMQWSSGMYFHPYLAERTGRLLLDSNFWNHVDFTDFSVLSGFQPELYETMAIEMDELTVSRTDCGASVAIYKDDEVVLTSLQDYWKGKIGFQQWPIAANVGGTAVYTASGRVESDWTQRNTSNFNEHLPYIEQNGNVALVMYRPQRIFPILPFVNKDVALHWIEEDFDTVEESGNWLFGERNGSYIAVRRACVGEINGVRACETDGGQTWVFAVGNSNRYGSFANFQSVASSATFSEDWTTDANGDSTYHASITFENATIQHSWGPEQPFTSIHELIAQPLQLYPNPSDGRFEVTLPNGIVATRPVIRVVDLMGRHVPSYLFNSGDRIVVDIRSAEPGIYTLLLDNGTEKWTSRVVKMP